MKTFLNAIVAIRALGLLTVQATAADFEDFNSSQPLKNLTNIENAYPVVSFE